MPLRRWSLPALALAMVLAILGACANEVPAEPRQVAGAHQVAITTSDGLTLSAQHWARSDERLIIYLHEFREDQTSWWPWASGQRLPNISALTIDFRGHGESEGLDTDVAGMVPDVEAAIGFARDAGYQHVMLAGAGMGGAIAISAAAGDSQVTVIGLSVPSEFGESLPLADALGTPDLPDRVWLIASEGDISASTSLLEFRESGGIHDDQSRLFSGGDHGIELLEGSEGAAVSRLMESVMEDFWVAAR